jgi:hypothetical protein
MKKYVFILFLSALTITASAQKGEEKGEKTEKGKTKKSSDYSENVATVDSTIKTFYKAISGKKGEKRDWTLFKFLFHADAKLITAGKNNDREFLVNYMSAADYVKNTEKWMVTNGFIQKEISRKSEVFGKMAHVFSTYECFINDNMEAPEMRGINSIQLLNDGERWWIMNVYWTKESWLNPIPSQYLD